MEFRCSPSTNSKNMRHSSCMISKGSKVSTAWASKTSSSRMILDIVRLFTFIVLLTSVCAGDPKMKESADSSPHLEPKKVNSLIESINHARKDVSDNSTRDVRKTYWSKVFEEIRGLSVGSQKTGYYTVPTGGNKFFSQWKLKLENTNTTIGPRFEGFASWERMLQDWADEIQDYLDRVQEEAGSEYPMSSYGRPSRERFKTSDVSESYTTDETQKPPFDIGDYFNTTIDLENQTLAERAYVERALSEGNSQVESIQASKRKKRPQLPKPAPAKPGEEVLPHTDLRDKSKRIEIVTTAALPWRTGTAGKFRLQY